MYLLQSRYRSDPFKWFSPHNVTFSPHFIMHTSIIEPKLGHFSPLPTVHSAEARPHDNTTSHHTVHVHGNLHHIYPPSMPQYCLVSCFYCFMFSWHHKCLLTLLKQLENDCPLLHCLLATIHSQGQHYQFMGRRESHPLCWLASMPDSSWLFRA